MFLLLLWTVIKSTVHRKKSFSYQIVLLKAIQNVHITICYRCTYVLDSIYKKIFHYKNQNSHISDD